MILKMELQKIWRPKILLLIAVMGLLFSFLFLWFPLEYFPNGHPAEEQYQLMLDWKEKYGVEMEDAEYKDALEALKTKLGVKDKKADASMLMYHASESEKDPYLLQTWAGALFEYEIRYEGLEHLLDRPYTSAEQNRIQDIIQKEKRQGILPYEIMGNAWEYWRWASVFILFSVMVLLGPVVVTDALTGVRRLQYTSKRGRKILIAQFAAALLSALGIVILELLIFGTLYGRLGTWRFWEHPINSFFYGNVYWFDLELGQYLMLILALILLFAGGAAGIAFFFSCFSRNYISLMLKVIPGFLLLGALSNQCIKKLFTFQNPSYMLTGIQGIELCIAVIVLQAGLLLGLLALKRKLKITDKDAVI